MRCVLVVVGLVLVGSVAAQGVQLPNATGLIQPGAEWTVLRQAELDLLERATDPKEPVSRTMVLSAINDLRAKDRTSANLLLHRQGPGTDELQLINCYSADVAASSGDLLEKDAVEQIRDAIIEATSTAEQKVVCSGHETSQLWTIPSLLLRFEHDDPSSPWRSLMHIVPAGDHLQYFECQYMVSDKTALQNFQDVLATFDGAKEPESRASNLLIGGLAGAAAGVITALFRRKRQHQRMTAAGS